MSFPFIVTVFDQDNVRSDFCLCEEREVTVTSETINGNYEGVGFLDPAIKVWYFTREAHQLAFAERMAKKFPNKMIILASSTQLFSMKPTEVIKQSISVKGILP